jgi:hypothetical protein
MSMSLSQYPRPAFDTGRGFHGATGFQCGPGDPKAYGRYLRQDLGVTWFKALVAGNNQVNLANAFAQQGIQVIVRFYSSQPHPHFVVSPAEVRAYVDAGVHYFEWGNEPNLVLEWSRPSWDAGGRVDKVCEQFLRNADAIRKVGGIPLFPALSPGGDYPHHDWYRAAFDWLSLHDHLPDLADAALAIHNRPFNNPLSHSDATGRSFLDYEWIDDLVRSYVGRSLPLLGTSCGYEPGSYENPAFPPIDLQRHAAYNLELLHGFGPHGSRRWRDALFCQCLWLVDAFGHRESQEAAWHNNPRWAAGGNLPAVAALRDDWQARPFQRKWAWESGEPDYPQATWRGSPNSDPRPAGARPELVVLYPTGAGFYETMRNLQNPASETSYHYVVSRSGAVYQLVPEASRAWHAGDSSWENHGNVDDQALAVGLVNRNDGADAYPSAQIDEAAVLVRHLLARHGIALPDVVSGAIIRGGDGEPGLDLQAFREHVEGIGEPWPPDEVVRRAAWAACGLAYSPAAVLPHYAREHELGNPETPEFDLEYNGRLYRAQGFDKGIAFAGAGEWAEIQVAPW